MENEDWLLVKIQELLNVSSMDFLKIFFTSTIGEGEYIIPMCTVFGLEDDEKDWLVKNQVELNLKDQMLDRTQGYDGIQIGTSAYKVIQYFKYLQNKKCSVFIIMVLC